MKRKRRRKNAAVMEAMGGEEDPKEEAHQGPSTLADVREEYGPAVEDLGVRFVKVPLCITSQLTADLCRCHIIDPKWGSLI